MAPRKPAHKTNWIHFRVYDDLTARLDGFADDTGLNRSEAARVLLEKGLGTDADNAVSKQAVYRLSGVIRRASQSLISDFARSLPDEITRQLAVENGRNPVDEDEPDE